MDTSDYLFLNQEVCFRDEDEDPLPCPEEYQMVKIFSEDHKIKVQSPERLYEWPQYNEALNTTRTKGSGTAVSGGHQVFKPPKRGEKPRITCFDPQTVSIPLFKEACQGAMLGHLQPVRGRSYLALCGRCRQNIWEVACPAKCDTCEPTLVVHKQEIYSGRVPDANRGRNSHERKIDHV
uniref:Uncharacterized protein n=1 Tax=Trichogramma kaykai TaxID=54128 RepID=A0ABD2XIT5_9HYME